MVTGILGLLTAGILALVNNWITARAGVDENLRGQRLEVYPTLWQATGSVSRWPRSEVTHRGLEELHQTLRSWYCAQGGLSMSESTRARYGDVQELIATLLEHHGVGSAHVLAPSAYTDLMETTSALRAALTEDLDTRRRKSVRETRRRSQWHASAAEQARARIARADASRAA